MLCLFCKSDTRVVNSRHQKRLNQVWRRRTCMVCHKTFTSLEVADYHTSLLFVDKTGHEHPFERDILLLSLYDSLRHRQDAIETASALTATIMAKLLKQAANATLNRERVVKTTHETLKLFDRAAAVHYQAFHTI